MQTANGSQHHAAQSMRRQLAQVCLTNKQIGNLAPRVKHVVSCFGHKVLEKLTRSEVTDPYAHKHQNRLITKLYPRSYGRAKAQSINQRKITIRRGTHPVNSMEQRHADCTASEVVCRVKICKVKNQ